MNVNGSYSFHRQSHLQSQPSSFSSLSHSPERNDYRTNKLSVYVKLYRWMCKWKRITTCLLCVFIFGTVLFFHSFIKNPIDSMVLGHSYHWPISSIQSVDKENIDLSKILVYVVYHDEKSQRKAQKFTTNHPVWTKSVLLKSSKFFESIFFRDILPYEYEYWIKKEYVGMISYRAVDISINNMTFKGQDIPIILSHSLLNVSRSSSSSSSSSQSNYDVIPLLQGQNMKLLHQAIDGHGKPFQTAWDTLLQGLGYTLTQIRSVDEVQPFFRNSFLVKPNWMKQYSMFLNRAMDITIYNDTIRSMMAVNATYDAAKSMVANKIFNASYYELYPFIFERLPIFYFHFHGATVYQYPNLRPKELKKPRRKLFRFH